LGKPLAERKDKFTKERAGERDGCQSCAPYAQEVNERKEKEDENKRATEKKYKP
jgi:hypothetical protein